MAYIHKRGNKYYYCFEISTVEGKRKRIERVGGSTKKECELKLKKAMKNFEEFGLIEEKKISFSDLLDNYFNEYVQKELKKSTIKTYKNSIKIIKESLGIYPVNRITTLILQDFFSKNSNKWTKSYLKIIKSVIKGSLSYAVRLQYIAISPCHDIYIKSKKNDKEYNYINDFSEIENILNELNEEEKIPFMIASYTGMRLSEILGLTWDNINFEEKYINIINNINYISKNEIYLTSTKTIKSKRIIFIPDILINYLKELQQKQRKNLFSLGKYYFRYYLEADNKIKEVEELDPKEKRININFVCCNNYGRLFTPNIINYITITKIKKIIPDFKFHLLRHFFISYMINKGINIKTVQEHAGHTNSITTLNIYTHSNLKNKKMIAEKLNFDIDEKQSEKISENMAKKNLKSIEKQSKKQAI